MTQSANLHLAGGAKRAAQGLDCDEDGVRLGDCFLVTRDPDEHQTFYRTRPAQDHSGLLSAAFGDAIDAERYHATLQRVARLMTAGQLGLAQITAIQMRPPDLPNEPADRLMKADALLRFNPNHRGPGPGGGQFISGPSGGGGAAAKPATRPAARSARKPNTTRRPTAPPKREPSLSGPSGGGASGKIQQLGRIINSGEGNYESYNTSSVDAACSRPSASAAKRRCSRFRPSADP